MGLEFNNIHHAYGRTKVLHDISFQAENGEITCLLGPSGCGKTTLLQIAAGILKLQQGRVALNGKIMAEVGNNPPPEKRSTGLVFQDGALFPHLSVKDNIGFGLRDKKEKVRRVNDLLDKIGLSEFGVRFPSTLSGGQQQRVAFARAIAPSPSLLLLDEPFANVDIRLRKDLRAMVRSILQQENCAVIMVTHDPSEALEIADKIVVLGKGRVIQFGSTEDLYDYPAAPAVESLLGGGQILLGALTQNHIVTQFGQWDRKTLALRRGELALGDVDVAVRAEDLQVAKGESHLKVVDITCIGPGLRATIMDSETSDLLSAIIPRRSNLSVGDRVVVMPREASVLIFPKA